jgi:hypothetical protein
MGPFIIVYRQPKGSYTLAELGGTLSSLWFAANRVIPYHPQDPLHIPFAQLPSINKELHPIVMGDLPDDLTRDGQYLTGRSCNSFCCFINVLLR